MTDNSKTLTPSRDTSQAIYEAVLSHINKNGGAPGGISETGLRSRIKTRVQRIRRGDSVTYKFSMPEQDGIPAFSVKMVKPRGQAEADEAQVKDQRAASNTLQSENERTIPCEPMGADLGPSVTSANDEPSLLPTLARGAIRAMLEGVVLTASKDPNRPHLHGILIKFNRDSIELVSTDGHRLTHCRASYVANATGPAVSAEYIVPLNVALSLLKALRGPASSANVPIEFQLENRRLIVQTP